uniref:Pterin-binding domain-containing protein n=1 Tax=Salix viminalis TaxID=40686 RepID=A0A6N2MLG0_SALVM
MLCIAKSTLSHNWASLPTGSSRRSQVYGINPNSHLPTSKHNHRTQFLGYQKMNIFTTTPEANLGSGIGSSLNSLWDLHLVAYTKTTETVAETVEKVADKLDKVAEDLADILPEGKLKQAVRVIEDIAEEAEKDAHLVDEAIEKLEEIEIGLKEEAGRFVQTNAKSKEAEKS